MSLSTTVAGGVRFAGSVRARISGLEAVPPAESRGLEIPIGLRPSNGLRVEPRVERERRPTAGPLKQCSQTSNSSLPLNWLSARLH